MNVLHIYGQGAWHSDVFIVGDAHTLRALRDAIDAALSMRVGFTPARGEVYVNDGEGYQVIVVCENGSEKLSRLAVPYTEDYAREKSDTALGPVDLLSVDELRVIAGP